MTVKERNITALKKGKISVTIFLAFDSFRLHQHGERSASLQSSSVTTEQFCHHSSSLDVLLGLHLKEGQQLLRLLNRRDSLEGSQGMWDQQLSLDLCPRTVALLWLLFSSQHSQLRWEVSPSEF